MLKHLSLLGLRVNWEKSKLVPMQRISFLSIELNSVNQTARLTQEHAQSVLNNVVQMCHIIFTTNRLDFLSHFKIVLLAVVFKSIFIFYSIMF